MKTKALRLRHDYLSGLFVMEARGEYGYEELGKRISFREAMHELTQAARLISREATVNVFYHDQLIVSYQDGCRLTCIKNRFSEVIA